MIMIFIKVSVSVPLALLSNTRGSIVQIAARSGARLFVDVDETIRGAAAREQEREKDQPNTL